MACQILMRIVIQVSKWRVFKLEYVNEVKTCIDKGIEYFIRRQNDLSLIGQTYLFIKCNRTVFYVLTPYLQNKQK